MSKLNYCIIKGETPKEPCLVYVIYPNSDFLDNSVIHNPHFHDIKKVLMQFGFEHVMDMTFKNNNSSSLKVRTMESDMKVLGFDRNKAFEKVIRKQLQDIRKAFELTIAHDGSMATSTQIPTFSNPESHGNIPVVYLNSGNNTIVKKRRKSTVVKVGGTIRLHVYLFIRTIPTTDGSIEFDFEFDFFSRSNNETRRFIKMIECTFVRKDEDVDGIMYLESEKTTGDILRELEFLYSIRLLNPFENVLSGGKPRPMIYNALELKDFLELNGKISLHINIDENYDEVIALSEKIRKEKLAYEKNMQNPVRTIKRATNDILERMEQRMLFYSNQENYELAAAYKKNREYVQGKIELLTELENSGVERLSAEEYDRCFTMKDLTF